MDADEESHTQQLKPMPVGADLSAHAPPGGQPIADKLSTLMEGIGSRAPATASRKHEHSGDAASQSWLVSRQSCPGANWVILESSGI